MEKRKAWPVNEISKFAEKETAAKAGCLCVACGTPEGVP
jgi:hypothetical protein